MSNAQQMLDGGRNKEITFLRVAVMHDAIQETTGHFKKSTIIFDFACFWYFVFVYLQF